MPTARQPRPCTEAERHAIEDNRNLPAAVLRHMLRSQHGAAVVAWLGGYDEALSEALYYFVRCVQAHDPAKGTLATFCYHSIPRKLARDAMASHKMLLPLGTGFDVAEADPVGRLPADEARALARALDRLEGRQGRWRELLRRRMAGDSLDVLARERGVSRQAVSRAFSRALAALRADEELREACA